MRTFVLALAAAALLAGCGRKSGKPPVRVAAAADLAFAFEEVGAAFEKQSGHRVSFSFGSTGLLSKQIIEGAPFDVFAAANVSYADQVVKSADCDGASKKLYARGRIVVWTQKGGVAAVRTLAELTDARFRKIAIANPEHAPYGKAAQDALTTAGLWDAVKPKLVFGENVQATLKWAQTGDADAAIVALSLAIVTENGTYMAIDPALHAPIDQALVVCAQGRNLEGGRAFTAFVGSEEGRAIMRRFGFLLPGETMTAER